MSNLALGANPSLIQTLAPIVGLWADHKTDSSSPRRQDLLKYKANIVLDFFAHVQRAPGAITPLEVKAYQAHLEEQGLKPSTVYSRLSQLSSFYQWAIAQGHAAHNPVSDARPKAPKAYQNESTQALADEDVVRLLEYVSGKATPTAIRDYAMLLFYFFTGKRRNEICGLTWGDVRIERGRVLITSRVKGGDYVSYEVKHPKALAALGDYVEAAGIDLEQVETDSPVWLVLGDKAGTYTGRGVSSHGFVKNLKSYARKAGLGDIHLHQSRHTYARWVGEESGSLLEAQDALGHKNLATTKVYLQRVSIKKDKFSSRIGERLGL